MAAQEARRLQSDHGSLPLSDATKAVSRITLGRVDFQKHLLIDGSNILHAWPELSGLLKRDRNAARSRLSQAASAIHDVERIRLSLIFDGRGEDLIVEQPSGQATFVHFYTPSGTTADDVIEQLVAQSAAPENCIVATDDRAERQTIEALGAIGMSAADLAAWVGRASRRQQSNLAELKRLNEKEWKAPKSRSGSPPPPIDHGGNRG